MSNPSPSLSSEMDQDTGSRTIHELIGPLLAEATLKKAGEIKA